MYKAYQNVNDQSTFVLAANPAPYFFVAAKVPAECIAVEGPFFGANRMQHAVDSLNKVFKLRDCSQKQTFHFAEQLSLFELDHRPGCLRLEIGTCSGPCAAACSQDEYKAQVNAAESFLDGFNNEPLIVVADQMEQASSNRQYELAARALGTLKSLEYVHRKLSMLAKARRDYTFIYPVSGYDGCHTWYLIHCGEVAEAIIAPRTPSQYAKMKPKLQQWKSVTSNRLDRGHGKYPFTLSLVASWFRKQKEEKSRAFAPNEAGRKYASAKTRQAS